MKKEMMQSSENEAHQRYKALKGILLGIQHVENGELIPNNQSEFDSVKKEIEDIEKQYPHFNFFKSTENS